MNYDRLGQIILTQSQWHRSTYNNMIMLFILLCIKSKCGIALEQVCLSSEHWPPGPWTSPKPNRENSKYIPVSREDSGGNYSVCPVMILHIWAFMTCRSVREPGFTLWYTCGYRPSPCCVPQELSPCVSQQQNNVFVIHQQSLLTNGFIRNPFTISDQVFLGAWVQVI